MGKKQTNKQQQNKQKQTKTKYETKTLFHAISSIFIGRTDNVELELFHNFIKLYIYFISHGIACSQCTGIPVTNVFILQLCNTHVAWRYVM